MKLRLLAVALFLVGIVCLAQQSSAQLTMTGVGGGFGGAPSYTGPIDINGAAYAFWSTRCGATSYSGNVADIWDSATGSTTETLVTCSPGGTLNFTVNPLSTTCAAGCVLKTLYDQSGASNCGGACNFTQATLADMPSITQSCQNSKFCITFNGTSQCMNVGSAVAAHAIPITTSFVYKYTNPTSEAAIVGTATVNIELQADPQAIASEVGALNGGGANASAAASDNAIHAVQALLNGTTLTTFYVDGTLTTPGAALGTQGIDNSTFGLGVRGACSGANKIYKGNMLEFGFWAADKTANNSSMNSNQHSYWSF